MSQQLLGRPRGARIRRRGPRIRRMDAVQLVNRTVVNEHGAPFRVGGLTFDVYTGTVCIDLVQLDDDGEPTRGTECGVVNLEGWDVY